MNNLCDLTKRVAVITGGGGLLGRQHALALAGAGATVVIADINKAKAKAVAEEMSDLHHRPMVGMSVDVAEKASVYRMKRAIGNKFHRVDILINNAAVDAKVEKDGLVDSGRFENFSLNRWNKEMRVGLTGAFICSQVFGVSMAKLGGGVILNIASDLSVIAPDQRLYAKPGLAEHKQPVKPVTYCVLKTALVGLTRYLATYWAEKKIRVNALSPGGVFNGQSKDFVTRLQEKIPMGRMARKDEYRGAVLFLCSDASAYMTGQNIVVDGGRSTW